MKLVKHVYIKVDPASPSRFAVFQGNWMTMPRSMKLDVNLTQKLGLENAEKPRSQTKVFISKECYKERRTRTKDEFARKEM